MSITRVNENMVSSTSPSTRDDFQSRKSFSVQGISCGECGGEKVNTVSVSVCENIPDDAASEFPEGGFRAWGVVFGG
jgi:hypothetical protein